MRQTKNKSSEKFSGFIRLLRLGGDEDSEEEEDEKNEKKSKTVEKLSDGKQQQKAGSSTSFKNGNLQFFWNLWLNSTQTGVVL